MTLISVPLMTIVMPLNQALGIILPILIFSDFIAVYKYRKEFDLGTLKLMVPFAAIGIFIGEKKSEKNQFKGGVCSTIAGFTSFCVHVRWEQELQVFYKFLFPVFNINCIEEKLFYNILYALIFISSTKLLYDFLI